MAQQTVADKLKNFTDFGNLAESGKVSVNTSTGAAWPVAHDHDRAPLPEPPPEP
jgi:hypothetical protein